MLCCYSYDKSAQMTENCRYLIVWNMHDFRDKKRKSAMSISANCPRKVAESCETGVLTDKIALFIWFLQVYTYTKSYRNNY